MYHRVQARGGVGERGRVFVIGVLPESAVAHTGVVLLLVPADPLRPRRPDEHFAPEAAAARDAGHDVALIDHDALAEPDGAERAVARVPDGGGAAVYRGWMLASGQYAALASALAARGTDLRTSAAQYRRAHELPGWYPALAPVTRPRPGLCFEDGSGQGLRPPRGRTWAAAAAPRW